MYLSPFVSDSLQQQQQLLQQQQQEEEEQQETQRTWMAPHLSFAAAANLATVAASEASARAASARSI